MFDKVIVAVARNPKKSPMFSVEERQQLLADAINHNKAVEIDSFEGLLIAYARRKGVKVVLRGCAAVSDFEYEFQMANMNRTLDSELETVFVMTGEDYFYISSQIRPRGRLPRRRRLRARPENVLRKARRALSARPQGSPERRCRRVSRGTPSPASLARTCAT